MTRRNTTKVIPVRDPLSVALEPMAILATRVIGEPTGRTCWHGVRGSARACAKSCSLRSDVPLLTGRTGDVDTPTTPVASQ